MIINKVLLILFSIMLNTSNTNDDFFQVKLPDLNNNIFSFSDLSDKKATAVIFLLSDCPASQSYTLTLNKLSKKYTGSNVAFVGVFPGHFSTDKELLDFKKEYKITFPLIKDPEMQFTAKLKAKIGPSCFLINQDGNVVYKGRIDDWLFALGKKRLVVTEKNLEEAIISTIKNEPVKIRETNPIGCILEYGTN